MSQTGGPVQAQLELSNSALMTKKMVTTFLQVCVDDDVQPLAAVAMEALGNLILVSQERIKEADLLFQPAPSQGKPAWPTRKFLKRLGVMAGVTIHGWPEAFSESLPLKKTFLLATACKVCFTDAEVARILYEMTWLGREAPKARFYPDQAGHFIDAISGYSDTLVPYEHYSKVVNAVRSQLSAPDDMAMLFERCPPDKLGEILVNVFDALRDHDISRVTIEGARNGYWIATVLSWLLPEDTECSLKDRIIFGKPGARLGIRLIDEPHWHIAQWTLERKLDPIVINSEGAISSLKFSPTPHTSFATARAEIAAQFGFPSKPYEEATGMLAAAIVNVAYQKGELRSDKCNSSERLKAICSMNFMTSHGDAIRKYGWHWDDRNGNDATDDAEGFKDQQNTITEAISSWLEPANPRRASFVRPESTCIKSIIREIYECNIAYYDRYGKPLFLSKVDHCLKIIEPAVYLAVDALLACFAEGLYSARVFHPCDDARLQKHAEILYHMVFEPSLPALATEQKERGGYFFADFWSQALRSSLPGQQQVISGDLAIAGNGYVAYAKILEGISTGKRDISLIATVPGALRRLGSDLREGGRARKLVEIAPTASLCGRELHVRPGVVQPFASGNTYLGIEPRQDPNGVKVKYLVDRSNEETSFRLTTLLQASLSPRSITKQGLIVPTGLSAREPIASPVSWVDSIEAIAFAEHVHRRDESLMRPEVEREVAEEWRKQGVFDEILWHETGKAASQENHSISMTATDDELRFFEAGYLGQQGKLFVRHDAPLVSCLVRANASKMNLPQNRWAIVT